MALVEKMRIRGLRSMRDVTAVSTDSNGVPLDAYGNPLYAGTGPSLNMQPTSTAGANPLSSLFTGISQGISDYATAQQTNEGLRTVANVATIGLVVWGAVKILGK